MAEVAERGRAIDDLFLAQFVLDYDEMLRGGSTPADFAERHERSAKTIENSVDKAKRRGLWATTGSGTRGQPTTSATARGKGSDQVGSIDTIGPKGSRKYPRRWRAADAPAGRIRSP